MKILHLMEMNDVISQIQLIVIGLYSKLTSVSVTC